MTAQRKSETRYVESFLTGFQTKFFHHGPGTFPQSNLPGKKERKKSLSCPEIKIFIFNFVIC